MAVKPKTMAKAPGKAAKTSKAVGDSQEAPREKHQKAKQMRRTIVLAAQDDFNSEGYEGLSLRRVAQKANTSLSLVLYHFGNKFQLWQAVVEHAREVAAVDRLIKANSGPGDSATKRLKSAIRSSVELFATYPTWNRMTIQNSFKMSDRLRWLIDTYSRSDFETYVSLIKEAQAEGTVHDVDPSILRFMLMSMTSTPASYAAFYEDVTGRNTFSRENIELTIQVINNMVFKEEAASD